MQLLKIMDFDTLLQHHDACWQNRVYASFEGIMPGTYY
jgi:hypothetical protein